MGGGNLHRTPAARVSRSVRSYALALCMAFAIAAVPVQAQVKNITLKASNTPVSTVMQQIEEQSGYTFFYNTKDIPLDRNVTLSVANKDIRAALDELFRNTNVSYSIDNKSIILSARGGAQPQQASQITGRIVDKNGVPVIGATIMISGTTQGTTSGVDGTFALQSNVSPAGMILDVSFIGYKPQRISVNNRTSLSVTLEEDDQQIEAVVVTALGIKRQERAVSYNVQNISDEVFLTRDANMVNSLAGKIAGVTINASAAGVGGETKVVMRGSKSIAGSNNALYVLDGIPLPSLSLTNPGDEFTIMRENNLTGDGISNFNPDDIASMAALTGPSAAALYGSQAANGVLMLTTRSGEEGVSVNYSNNTTFMSPFLTPAFQNTYGAKDGYYASWGTKLAAKQSWTPTDFYQTGYNTSNSVGLSFGGKKSQTYVSAGVVTAEGIIPNNEYNRYNFTANHSSSFLDERMHLSVLGMYMNVNEQNMLSSGQYYNPMIPVYLMSPSDDIRKYAVYERYNASRNFPVQYWPWGSQSLQMQNPYWITNRNMFNTGKDRFLFGASLKYDVTDWLDITGRARIDYTHITAEQKNYASTLGLFAGDKGRYYNNTYTTSQRYADVLANVHKTFADGAFSLNATLGASIEDYKHRAILLGGDLTGVPNLFTLANMTTNKSQAKETINDQTQSLFATLQLGYKNMVFLDVTARNDWVTALANTSKTSMFYPSVGLSAVLTDIFKVDSRVLSFAKIRASYAEVGNAPMRWITIPTYPVSDGTPQTSTYLTSDDFKPERTKSWEVGADGAVRRDTTFTNYTTFSLWDTYRAAHPLLTLIHPEKVGDLINTMLRIHEQQGKLPVWHLMGCETDCMVGNPAIPVVADALLKGFGGFDRAKAYEAMKSSAMRDDRGLDLYKRYGYIPYEFNESVGYCLEYAIADWALAQAAQREGRREDYDYFLARSKAYRHYFDPSTGFIRGRSASGAWRTPFDPFHSRHMEQDYTEGNAWQYTWLVPHDIEGLMECFGGRERFVGKLDSLFLAEGDMGAHASPDISGLIGQYAHGNEPSHHITYIYTMIGQPWKCAEKVRRILGELYHDRPEGLCGNEDVGQMSAWYVLSALGMYQAEPAGGRYFFGSPAVDGATLRVRGGEFRITAADNSPENIYIQRITLNGEAYRKYYIDYAEIAAGGELRFEMGPEPADWTKQQPL